MMLKGLPTTAKGEENVRPLIKATIEKIPFCQKGKPSPLHKNNANERFLQCGERASGTVDVMTLAEGG